MLFRSRFLVKSDVKDQHSLITCTGGPPGNEGLLLGLGVVGGLVGRLFFDLMVHKHLMPPPPQGRWIRSSGRRRGASKEVRGRRKNQKGGVEVRLSWPRANACGL